MTMIFTYRHWRACVRVVEYLSCRGTCIHRPNNDCTLALTVRRSPLPLLFFFFFFKVRILVSKKSSSCEGSTIHHRRYLSLSRDLGWLSPRDIGLIHSSSSKIFFLCLLDCLLDRLIDLHSFHHHHQSSDHGKLTFRKALISLQLLASTMPHSFSSLWALILLVSLLVAVQGFSPAGQNAKLRTTTGSSSSSSS